MKPQTVLLINPCATYSNEIAQKCYPPLNLLYLARALLRAGVQVHVLDANALALPRDQTVALARQLRPDLVGIPLYTEILSSVHRLAQSLREALPETRLVLGGAHASALPRETLDQFPAVDFILAGPAERSIVQLSEALSGARGLVDVEGLTYRADGAIAQTALAAPGRQLDDVGTPARELVQKLYDRGLYYTLLVRTRPVDTLVTSRGCPFACTFCYNQDHAYRHHSVDHVMDEILSIHGRGVRDIEIVDDTFTFHRERALEILGRIIKERLPLSFRIKSRVDVIDPEFVRTARRAGVYMISYGMESADDEILRRMNKRTTVEQNERAARLTMEAGIACHTSWIIGHPGETPESIARTIDFIVKVKPTTAQIGLLRPYPQTTVYREAKDLGWLRGEWRVDSDEYPWVQLPWVRDRTHIEGIVQRAVRQIYFRPHYLRQFATMAIVNVNTTLARYAMQEARKAVMNLVRPGAKRSGSL